MGAGVVVVVEAEAARKSGDDFKRVEGGPVAAVEEAAGTPGLALAHL